MTRGNLLSQKAEFIVNMLQTRSDSGADGDKRRRPEAECSNSPPKSFVKFISCNNLVQAKKSLQNGAGQAEDTSHGQFYTGSVHSGERRGAWQTPHSTR